MLSNRWEAHEICFPLIPHLYTEPSIAPGSIEPATFLMLVVFAAPEYGPNKPPIGPNFV